MMRLVTDFRDYYDHAFSLDGTPFHRLTKEGPDKKAQFEIFQEVGLMVPPHGAVKDIAGSWWEEEKQWIKWVVVYNDLQTYCGEGKVLMQSSRFKWGMCLSRLEQLYKDLDQYCSAYVGNGYFGKGYSWRMLQVGPHRFWIEYESITDWRSNCGERSCKLFSAEMEVGFHPQI